MKEEITRVAKEAARRASDYSGSKKRKFSKGILGIVIVLLLGALGMEVSNTDLDLGSLLSGESVGDSVIERDIDGNLNRTEDGGFVTRVMRDREGNVVESGQPGAKYTDEYNCDDFANQLEAQRFYEKAGGVEGDTNRLDGDKNGEACQSLPKGG